MSHKMNGQFDSVEFQDYELGMLGFDHEVVNLDLDHSDSASDHHDNPSDQRSANFHHFGSFQPCPNDRIIQSVTDTGSQNQTSQVDDPAQ